VNIPDLMHMERFLNRVLDPDAGWMELVLWGVYLNHNNHFEPPQKYPQTYGGWFDSPRRIIDTAKRLRGVSIYASFNPVHPDKAAQSPNALKRFVKGDACSKEDITSLRHILIDIDYQKSVTGGDKLSSTASELQAALDLRATVLEKRPEIGENAIYGCSGNGAWILVKIADWPNNQKTVGAVKNFLTCLAEDFGKKGRDRAHIDVHPHFPNAHIGLPGTLKCKGVPSEERPHRIITVDGGF